MRHTLATVQTRKQINDLVAKIEALYPGCSTVRGNTTVVVRIETGKVFSAVTAGGKWSAQVSADIAKEFNLPLWKDIQQTA